MSDRNLSYEDLLQILKLVESSSQFAEFRLKLGDIEIDLRKASPLPAPCSQEPPSSSGKALSPPEMHPSAKEGSSAKAAGEHPQKADQRTAHAGYGETMFDAGGRSAGEVSSDNFPEGVILIKSPMVGTFYHSPEPGASPFVEVDQWVTPETTVCIIEVMKLMNSIKAGHSGNVTHILVNDGEPVEFGQVLMVIDPNGGKKE